MISNVLLSLHPIFMSRSLSLTHNIFMSWLLLSLSLTHTLLMSRPFLLTNVLIDIRIYFTYLHWAFCHLLIYSSLRSFENFTVCPYIILPCSFESFSVYSYILILRISLLIFIFWSQQVPPILKSEPALNQCPRLKRRWGQCNCQFQTEDWCPGRGASQYGSPAALIAFLWTLQASSRRCPRLTPPFKTTHGLCILWSMWMRCTPHRYSRIWRYLTPTMPKK